MNKYHVNRPTWAGELQALGFEATPETNPWNPGKQSWCFELCPDLARELLRLHKEIGKQPPYFLQKYEEGNGNV